MNRREQNKMNMYQAVDAILAQYEETIAALKPLESGVAHYRESLLEILKRDREYLNATHGVTLAKNEKGEELVNKVHTFAMALYACGRATGSEGLKAECDLTLTDLHRSSGQVLRQKSVRIAELVSERLEELGAYGVGRDDLDALKAAIEEYGTGYKLQQQKMAVRKTAREALYKAFDNTDDILKNDLDVLMSLVKVEHPEFHHRYRAVRLIKDLGGHVSRSREPGAENGTPALAAEEPVDKAA